MSLNFFDTVRGIHFADTLIRELPKLNRELPKLTKKRSQDIRLLQTAQDVEALQKDIRAERITVTAPFVVEGETYVIVETVAKEV